MAPLGIVAAIVIIAAVAGGGDSDKETSSPQNNDSTSNDAGNNNDSAEQGAVAIGETVSLKKADITFSNLREENDPLGATLLCGDVDFANTREKDELNINGLTDWKMQDPNGVSRDMAITGMSNYDAVELAPGGSTSATACFETDGTPGEYLFTYTEGLSFSSDEAQWKAEL